MNNRSNPLLNTLLLLSLLLTGCLKNEPHRPLKTELTTPETWNLKHDLPSATAVLSESWWQDFESEELNKAIEAALEHNLSLALGSQNVTLAANAVWLAGAAKRPEVSAGLNSQRQKQPFIGFDDFLPPGSEAPSPTYSQWGATLNTQWEIDLWGRLKAYEKAAVADHEASLADLNGLRLSIAAQTAKAWLAASEAHAQVALNEELLARYESEVSRIQARFEKGLRSSLDVRLARANLENTKALSAQWQMQYELATQQLQRLMGRYPDGNQKHAQGIPSLPPTLPASLPADLISRRPDLVAAQRRVFAADMRLKAARRSLYPQLSLVASSGLASPDLDELVKGNFSLWNIAGNLVQPIFQGGRLRANIARAETGVDISLLTFMEKALNAYAEVQSALTKTTYLKAQMQALEEAEDQAKAAAELAQRRYNRGLGSYFNVLEAQRRELNARAQLTSLRVSNLSNRVDLYMALGGGFQNQKEYAPVMAPQN